MTEARPSDLELRLREADSKELVRLLREHIDDLDASAACQALRNPFLNSEAVGILCSLTRLLRFYEVRRELALHPQTRQSRAMDLAGGLYWRDLVRLGADTRVRPTVRRVADRSLVERLPGLSEGERIAIARSAALPVITYLRFDPSPRVLAALLENPRLTEVLLEPVVNRATTPAENLDLIARSQRWGNRYSLKAGLCRNGATPVSTVLSLLSALKKPDLKAVARDPRLHEAVRRRARLLLGEEL